MAHLGYHIPVMLQECISGLNIRPDGVYVDVTFGGGGHSRSILEKLNEKGRLIAFDQDPDALENRINDKRFVLLNQNFRYLKNNLRLLGVHQVNGILADLGVSSHQIDAADRGFATRFEADLDMRMDQVSELDAKQVLNTYSEEQLHRIFGEYGEVKNARSLAKRIISARVESEIKTTERFKKILEPLAPRGREYKYYAQVFQALRIEVNGELDALQDFLQQSAEMLKTNGRLVVMSYHSLEDRLVKRFMQMGKFSGEVEKDFYGNPLVPFKIVTRKPILAEGKEIAQNNRARSAKLRIAEK